MKTAWLAPFSPDVAEVQQRLRRRLSRGELFALALALSLVGVFVWLPTAVPFDPYIDLAHYLNTGHGDFTFYYYAYWYVPLFEVLSRLPLSLSYVLWSVANIAGVFFAARVWGGSAALAVVSYQMFYSLFYGQITGLVVGGLAVCWWGLLQRRWNVAGLGIALASVKFQLGLTGSLFLWLLAPLTGRERLRVLIVPLVVGLASLALYPAWPVQLLDTYRANPPLAQGSIALWRWLGPLALLLWLPPLLVALTPGRRFVALSAATALGLPYFQQQDLLQLLVLPIGWLALLGNLGYLFVAFEWIALQALVVVPLTVYLAAVVPPLVEQRKKRAALAKPSSPP